MINRSQLIIQKTWHKHIILNANFATPKIIQLLENPDKGLEGDLLKHDTSVKIDSTIVGKLFIDDRWVVVKRYNIKSFWHGLKKCLWRTRAKKCWQSAHHLLRLGFFTPTPIAIIEKRFGPFRRQSYYIYEYLPGKPIKELLSHLSTENQHFFDLTNLLTNTLLQFRRHRIYHGDMKLLNFLVHEKQLIILDLDSMSIYKSPLLFHFQKQKDAKHLLFVNFKEHKIQARNIEQALKKAKLLE